MGKTPARGTSQLLHVWGERNERALERVPFLTHVNLRTAAQRHGAGKQELDGAADSDDGKKADASRAAVSDPASATVGERE
jgi:hypothetical protein